MGYICMFIYLIGWVASVKAIIDIFRLWEIKLPAKIGLSALTFLTSWVGYFAYFYVIRVFIINEARKKED